MSALPLWDHFCVVGLSSSLVTVQGEQGWLGSQHRYKPHLLDSLPHDGSSGVPPELPTCCLPAGVDIMLYADVCGSADPPTQAFAFILTEGDGTKIYASCLAFHDEMPSELSCKHEELLGAKALKSICLLSHQPYLQSADQVLRELYRLAFWNGSRVPLPEIISSLLTVQRPQLGGSKVCLKLGHLQRTVCPPLAIGPPPGEMSLMPLLEVLRPDNLVALFAAVLLEQRVLLRSCQPWLLTVAAEGVVRLLYPLSYQHVYVPVMPYSLAEYLEAPTPFLMGLHSDEYVDPKTLEGLVVVDLDYDRVSLAKDSGVLQRCLDHPYMKQLRNRIRMLLRPSTTDVDALGAPQDPWVNAARQLSKQPCSPLCKQALLIRIFLEFFREVLDGYNQFLVTCIAAADGASTASSLSRNISGMQEQMRRVSSSAAQITSAAAAIAGSGSTVSFTAARHIRRSSSSAGQQWSGMHMPALLQHHQAICRHADPTLLQQVMQGLPFLSFIDKQAGSGDPVAWLKAAKEALWAWRAAEEELLTASDTQPGSDIDVICIPPQRCWPLMPSSGLLYSSFPALITTERDESLGVRVRRRCSGSSRKRQTGLGGKRRAISELMGQQIDLWGKGPSMSLNTDSPLPIMYNTISLLPNSNYTAAGLSLTTTMPHLGQLGSSSTLGSPKGSKLGVEYSAEADLVRRQTATLVQLMQSVPAGQEGSSGLTAEDLDAARLLLRVQTGGNGWFIVSKLKELITSGGSRNTTADAASRSQQAEPAGTASGRNSHRQTCLSENGAAGQKKKKRDVACHSSHSEASLSALSSRSSKSSITKSSKIFGGNSSSSTTGRSSSPMHARLAEGVDSLASAASAMASAFSATVLSRSGSMSRARSPSHSMTLPVVPASARTATLLEDVAASRASTEQKRRPQSLDLPRSASTSRTTASTEEMVAIPVAVQQLAMPFEQAAPVVANDSSRNSSSSSGSRKNTADGCLLQCCISDGVFGVLADMLSSMIEVAAVQEDFRVVLAALELACVIRCQQGTFTSVPLIHKLALSPILHTEWFWASAFSFAVSSSCLQGHAVVSVKDLVLRCLTDFACYMAGVGIPGYPAWLLLMVLTSEHLVHYGALEAHQLLELRAQLTTHESTAQQQLLALTDSAVAPAASSGSSKASAAPAGGCVQLTPLPDYVAEELVACGVAVSTSSAPRSVKQTVAGAVGSAAVVGSSDVAAVATAAAADRAEESTGSQSDRSAASGQVSDIAAGCNRRSCGKAMEQAVASSYQDIAASYCQQVSNTTMQAGAASGTPVACVLSTATEGSHGSVQPVHSYIAGQSPFAEQSFSAVAAEPEGSCTHVSLKAAALSCTGTSNSSTVSASVRKTTGRITPSERSSSRFSPRSFDSTRVLVTPRSARPKQYAELHARQNSPREGSNGSVAAADAAEGSTIVAGLYSGAAEALQVQEEGGSLQQPGAYHSAALHSKAVVAMEAANHTVLSVGMEGLLKVTDASDGHLHVRATMAIPSLQQSSSSADDSDPACQPVVKLWPDGQRAAIGNAAHEMVWVLDVQSARVTAELAGMGSHVSAIHTLQRNRDSLLTALSCSSARGNSNSSSGGKAAEAAVYLWDLRRPRRPAASLDLSGSAVQSSQPESAVGDGVTSSQQPPHDSTLPANEGGAPNAQNSGVLCLAVHSGGIIAAAGCQDGRVLLWDMRMPAVPMAACSGHQGPVRHVQFATPSTSAAYPLLVTGSDDWTARLWNATTGCCSATCVGHAAAVTAMQLIDDRTSSRLVTGAADGSIGVWGLGGEVYSLEQQHNALVQLLAAGDSTVIAGAQHNSSELYSASGVLACNIHRPPLPLLRQERHALVDTMAYDPIGQLLCSGHRDGLVSMWSCRH